jgi:hypothetical protein
VNQRRLSVDRDELFPGLVFPPIGRVGLNGMVVKSCLAVGQDYPAIYRLLALEILGEFRNALNEHIALPVGAFGFHFFVSLRCVSLGSGIQCVGLSPPSRKESLL